MRVVRFECALCGWAVPRASWRWRRSGGRCERLRVMTPPGVDGLEARVIAAPGDEERVLGRLGPGVRRVVEVAAGGAGPLTLQDLALPGREEIVGPGDRPLRSGMVTAR